MCENWSPVPNYEGLYEVSDLGRVKSLARTVLIKRKSGRLALRPVAERILKAGPGKLGHLSVSLHSEGEKKSHQVHTSVLEAFVGPRPCHHTEWHGCHGDGNPANNKLSNLRWATRSENENDKIAHGRSNRGERNRACKLTVDKAKEIKLRIAAGESSPDIAKDYDVTRGLINAIKRGDAWSWI